MEKNNKVENKFIGSSQYRGLAYKTDLNRDTVRFFKKYKQKIGYQLGGTVESMMMRRGQLIMMIANAGGGKTYCVLQTMAKLSTRAENENVRYVIAVPNRNQSNQNQKSDSLSRFKAKSIVGAKDGKRKVEVNAVTDKIFSCVYDKALELVEILKCNGHEVVLVLDECHKLIADNNFRGEAIANLEKAFKLADQTIMMTATPRRCLSFYKYSEIYHLIEEEAVNNIEDFKIVLTETGKPTLIKEIRRLLDSKIKYTEVIETEVWEETMEVISPETLLEILENPKYEKVRKQTATLITSKEIETDAKVLVRLNSIKEIERYIKLFEKAGIKAEKLTRKEKDGEVFRSIEEQSKIITESRVIFCTSIVECGVSLENQDIYLIEMIRSARDFDHDNTVQFFARPRKTIGKGVLIMPDYVNKRIRENVKKEVKDAKVKGIALDAKELMAKRKKDFSNSKDIIKEKANIAQYEKSLKKIESMYENKKNMSEKDTHELANMDLENVLRKLEYIKESKGEEQARVFLNDEITNLKANNPFFINVLEADYDNLKVYIDNKKVVDKAMKELDKDILNFNPGMLINYFEGKIFYNRITIEHCNLFDEIQNKTDIGQEFSDMVKYLQELAKAQKEVKAMEENTARELLQDDDFVKLLDDIVAGNIYKETLGEYTDKYTIKEILSFKESTVYSEYKRLKDTFSKDECITLLTTRVITKKAIEKRYKQVKRNYKTLTEKQFEEKMNIVPALDEVRYLKNTENSDMIERKHFAKNLNTAGRYIKGLHDKHSIILDVVLPAKTKDGKLTAIRPSRELLLKLCIELVDKKVYKYPEMEKAIKAIKRDAEKYNMKADLYSKVNIKKLECVYSSSKNGINNDLKMLNEISKVFKLATDTNGYKINSIIKTFDMASIISSIH